LTLRLTTVSAETVRTEKKEIEKNLATQERKKKDLTTQLEWIKDQAKKALDEIYS
jgi:hypothetical protein